MEAPMTGDDEEPPEYLQRLLDTRTVAGATDGHDHPLRTGINPEDDPMEPVDEADLDRDQPSPLLPSQVRYLVFSGGGAKAFAYLGALAALGDFGLVVNPRRSNFGPEQDPPDDYFLNPERIEGVAGSSAGAITAGLMAGLVGLNQAYELLTDERDMKRFFDRARLSTVEYPTLDGIVERTRPDRERKLVSGLMGPIDATSVELREYRADFLDYIAEQSGYRETVEQVIDPLEEAQQWVNANLTGRQLLEPAWWLGHEIQQRDTGLPPEVVRQVFQTGQFPLYLSQLLNHHGLFSGGYARGYFDDALRNGVAAFGDDPGPDVTFDQVAAASSIDLVVTGTQLETGTLGTFDAEATPDVPVADAIRLSMAIPFVFRPTSADGGDRAGTWVDGGLVNNFPMHAFAPDDRGASPTVLGLRLDPPAGAVDGLNDYVGAVFGSLLERTTDAQIRSSREASQVIGIPTGELGTLKFTPGSDLLDEVLKDAAQRVFEYFGQHPETAERDAERAVEVRVYGKRPGGAPSSAPSSGESGGDSGGSGGDDGGGRRWWVDYTPPDLPELPQRDPSIKRYSKDYITRKFRSEMLEVIKAGSTDGSSWQPHPLAFLLDPQVLRGDAERPPQDVEDLVDPLQERGTYIDGVSYWPSQSPEKYEDWYFLADLNRRVSVDAGHLTPREYLERDPYEYERLAFEDSYLNQILEQQQEQQGAVPQKWAVEIEGVPVEVATARRLEIDIDLQQAGYFGMSDERQAVFRREHFPIDFEFPDWEPFGGVLGGLPKGTVDRLLSSGHRTAGWIYVRGYDARRIPELEEESWFP